MPRFAYRGAAPDGSRVRGIIRGATVDGVTASLQAQGIAVAGVSERKRSLLQLEITPRKVKPADLVHFARHLSVFVKAGVPILDAFAILEEDTKDKTLKAAIIDIAASLRFGDDISTAFAAHAQAFPPFFVSVLRSAEVTGQLDTVLAQLSTYIERDLEARRKIRSALVYPSLVLALALVSVGVLAGFVLPRFQTFFDSLHAKLPLSTRILVAVSGFLTHFGLPLVGVVVLVVAVVVIGVQTARGKRLRDALLLRIPLIAPVVRDSVIERFARILSAMVHAGVALPDAFDLAAAGAANLTYAKALGVAKEEMIAGGGIARPLANTGLFPSSVVQMVRVGEETGTVDEQLDAVAGFFERELEYKLRNLIAFFEPAAILVVGLVVGFVAIALVSAIYGVYDQVKV